MTCSLQTYIQRIGRFNSGLAKPLYYRKSEGKHLGQFRSRMEISFIAAIYCLFIINLPILIQDHGQAELSQAHHGGGGGSGTTGCEDLVSTHDAMSAVWNCVAMSYYVWDPGPFHSVRSATDCNTHIGWATVGMDVSNTSSSNTVFMWISKEKINKLVYIINGNKSRRGQGITCAYWNKGPSLLTNKQSDIKTLIN